jgi:S1-C subfamily serine protease
MLGSDGVEGPLPRISTGGDATVVTETSEAGALLGLSNDLANAVERAGSATVTVYARNRAPSTGVHWMAGIVVTADHTLEREEGIMVGLPDGRTVPATVTGRDPSTDIAVLRIDAGDLPTAEIGESADLKVGHMVLAVGRPGEHGLAASWGAISALGGAWRTWGGGSVDQLIRPDVTLYPGFSGGPLVDARGQVVGINTSGLSRSLTLSIPTSTVQRVVTALLNHGRIARGYLGIAMQPVQIPLTIREPLALTRETGLIVVHVEEGGPAERAGVLVGDILVAIDGQPIADTDDVQVHLDPDRIGRPTGIGVVRGGVLTDLTLTIGARPERGA